MNDAVTNLVECAAVEQVLNQYASACDERNWPALEAVFTPDVTANYGGEFELQGREEVINLVRSMLGGCGPTQHLLGNFAISIEGQSATCQCYVRAIHAGKAEAENTLYEVWAQYNDQLQKTSQGWQISGRHMRVSKEVGSRSILQPES